MGGHRAFAKKLIAQGNIEIEKEDDAFNRNLLESIFEKLSEKIEKIKSIDEQIFELLDQDAVATEIESADDRNFEFEIFITKIKAVLSKTKTPAEDSTISKTNGSKGPIIRQITQARN